MYDGQSKLASGFFCSHSSTVRTPSVHVAAVLLPILLPAELELG
jgi:hypothetical protein